MISAIQQPVEKGIKGAAFRVARASSLCAINQATYLLRRQIESQGRDFVEDGGFAERLHTVRVQARAGKMSDGSDRSDTSDDSAPGASR